MTLWTLLQGVLLVMNGLAIVNNERFLEPNNWGFSQLGNNPMGPSPNALKYQVIGTLHAAAYMRGAHHRLRCCSSGACRWRQLLPNTWQRGPAAGRVEQCVPSPAHCRQASCG
jgi:hypothetical protein